MELQELLNKPLPQIPSEIIEALSKKQITKTTIDCKNEVLSNNDLQTEVGYIKMDDGTYFQTDRKWSIYGQQILAWKYDEISFA